MDGVFYPELSIGRLYTSNKKKKKGLQRIEIVARQE